VSLMVGVMANLLAVTLGIIIGMTAGYLGGWIEVLLMRFTDIMMAFPTLLLAMTLVAILKPSLWIIIVVIGLVYWTWIAKVVYGQVLTIRELEFVTAARALGASRRHIILHHILPQLIPTIIVWGTLGIATNVMLEASLSYLGIGVQPPTPSWGGMIQQGQSYYRSAPWLVIYPGLAIMVTVFAFNLLGDGLRDALDPTQRGIR
jgi:peptide/nickel transport system permease protein